MKSVTIWLILFVICAKHQFNFCVFWDFEEMLVLNATSSYLDLVISNTSSTLTGDAGNSSKESFSSVLIKNIVAMLVWLALSIINCSMVHTFLRHRYTHNVSSKTTKVSLVLPSPVWWFVAWFVYYLPVDCLCLSLACLLAKTRFLMTSFC